MTFKIRHAVEADLSTIAALSVAAFKTSAYHQAVWPARLRSKPGDEEHIEFEVGRMRRSLDNPTSHLIVAEDAGRAVGFAEWIGPANEQTPPPPRLNTTLPAALDAVALDKAGGEIRAILESDECVRAFQGRDRRAMWSMYAPVRVGVC